MDGRTDCLVKLDGDIEFLSPDGVFMKGMLIPTRGLMVSQHSHEYAHTSLLVKGSVRVWIEGSEDFRDYSAPEAIYIEAKKFHKFLSLADDTAVYCIHNVEQSGGKVKVHEYVKEVA